MQENIHDEAICGGNKECSEHLEDEANGTGSTETHGVFDHEEETVPGSWAEGLSSKCNLNVCVLRDELDESLQAVEAASGKAENDFDQWVLFVGLLDLSCVVLEHDTNKLDESNQEGAHGKGSEMVSVHPVNTLQGGSRSRSIRLAREVPLSASGCNDEHLATDDEGVQPEVAEQRIEYSVSCVIAPINLCKHWQVFSRSYFTDGSNVEGSYEPNNQPGEDEACANWWENVHLRCVLEECSCCLHDCNTDLDVLAVAKEADDEEGEDSPSTISSVGVVILVLVVLWQ